MLVLTRKPDQSITLGDPASAEEAIKITVLEVKGDQVRLGITAPRNVPVHRKEIWEQLQTENEAASQMSAEVPHGTPAKGPPAVLAEQSDGTVGPTLEETRRSKK